MFESQIAQLPIEERAFFKPVERDLTKLEALNMEISKYSPCGCGSGKKFKFCCYKSKHSVEDAEPKLEE